MRRRLFTVGHSTRELSDFLELLGGSSVELLVDVRRFPGSRRHPHFSRQELAPALADAGIAYENPQGLGGRRRGLPNSRNTAWRNAGFRAYADHMASPEFQLALAHLEELASARTAAVMCAEAVPWRCHRRLIADALVARGWQVVHLLAAGREEIHELHPDAVIEDDGQLVYPGSSERQSSLF